MSGSLCWCVCYFHYTEPLVVDNQWMTGVSFCVVGVLRPVCCGSEVLSD